MTRPNLSVSLIACLAPNNGIGKSGSLPWRLKNEMDYFRRVTTNVPDIQTPNGKPLMNAVVMGRKSWESIPAKFRPLKNRINIVVSASGNVPGIQDAANTHLVSSFPSALDLLSNPEIEQSLHRVFIIGGSSLYSASLSMANRLLITRIVQPDFPDCNVFFPEWDKSQWTLKSHSQLNSWVNNDQHENTMPVTVPEGQITEGDIVYRYEMWERS